MDKSCWIFEADNVKETWNQVENRFDLEKVNDKNYKKETDNIDLLQPQRCSDVACRVSPYYPRYFKYCPNCGSSLISTLGPNKLPWASPCGTLDGNRSFSNLKWVFGKDSHGYFKLPDRGGQFAFVVTGNERLLAIDRAHGQLFSFCVTIGEWIYHGAIPGIKLPPWAWLASPCPDGVAISTDEGPCWIKVPDIGQDFRVITLSEKKTYRAIGGAALWEDVNHKQIALAPVLSGEGLSMAWRPCSQENPWQAVEINMEGFAGEDLKLNAPTLNGGKDIFWSGKEGFIAVRMEQGLPKAKFYKWDRGHKGCPEFAPYRDLSGMLWQLCYDNEDNHYCFVQLSHSGIQDSKQVDGPHLCIGNKSFMTDKEYEEPWQEGEALDFYPEKLSLVQPLLYLSNGLLYFEVQNESKVRSFVENPGNYSCRLCIRKTVGGEEVLKEGLLTKSPWDAEIFLFNGSLNLYIASQNKCWTWPGKYEEMSNQQ